MRQMVRLDLGNSEVSNLRDSPLVDAPAAKIEPEPPVVAAQKPSPTQMPVLPDAKPAEPVPPLEKTTPNVVDSPPANRTPLEYPARLVSIPPGAILTIDSNPALTCATPCDLNLAPGRHTLSSSLNGYRAALRIFELPKESEITMHLEATSGTVMIRSDPPGGAIVVDGQVRSEKTPALITLSTGSHKIEVAREGFRNFVEVLDIKDAVITNIEVNWSSKTQ